MARTKQTASRSTGAVSALCHEAAAARAKAEAAAAKAKADAAAAKAKADAEPSSSQDRSPRQVAKPSALEANRDRQRDDWR